MTLSLQLVFTLVEHSSHFTPRNRYMTELSLDRILDELNSARQRATYGAVAGALAVSPRALMAGRERSQHDSWVVNLKTGLPTDYAVEVLHPELTISEAIITTKDMLLAWLAFRAAHASAEAAA